MYDNLEYKGELIKKLKEASVPEVPDPEDVDNINQVLSENNYNIALDFVGSSMEQDIYVSYYSDKLKKVIQLGRMRLNELEDVADEIDEFEEEAKKTEDSIKIEEKEEEKSGEGGEKYYSVTINHSFPTFYPNIIASDEQSAIEKAVDYYLFDVYEQLRTSDDFEEELIHNSRATQQDGEV